MPAALQPYTGSASILAPDASPAELVPYALLGFGVVMLALALLWLLTTGIGQVFRKLENGASEDGDKGAASLGPDRETLIVISAAVAATVDGPFRIASIKKTET